MAKKTIMLICSAGMSTTLLVEKMQQAAEKKNLDVNILAHSADEVNRVIKKTKIDVILLGPQVRFMKSKFEQKVIDKNIPVDVINMEDYGMVNGEKVLQMAFDLLN